MENPGLSIESEKKGPNFHTSVKWPEVRIEDVSGLEGLTYENIINAFGHLLTQPFKYNPHSIDVWRGRASERVQSSREDSFILFCEHWLIPVLNLIIFEGIGYSYKIDLTTVDDGDKVGDTPTFRTWPGRPDDMHEPDFGAIYTISKENKKPRSWIAVGDAKLAKTWSWDDHTIRRKNRGLEKFLWPCRQLAAYGVMAETQYAVALSPKQACFCRLVDKGTAANPNPKHPLTYKRIGILGATVDWSVSGRNRLTVLLGMVAWVLSAMNDDHRSIVPLSSQARMTEWVVVFREDETLYRNKISQIVVRELPKGAIIVS